MSSLTKVSQGGNSQQMHDRKLEHIDIVLKQEVQPVKNSLNKYKLPYKALPEVNYDKIDTSSSFLNKKLNFPFIISSMTGGPSMGQIINKHLAIAAQEAGVGLGLGSMRVILRKPESLNTFKVRQHCPDIPLLANMGLVQLNYGYGASQINYLCEAIDADGIFLHVNPFQEVIQPEGDTNFEGLLEKLAKELPKIERPVVIKEVGTGLDLETIQKLSQIGIKHFDISGAGGTSWVSVEAFRREDRLGHVMSEEALTTAEILNQLKNLKETYTNTNKTTEKIMQATIIAGGGIRTGLDIAKSIALGADLATAATPLLKPALRDFESVLKELRLIHKELKVAMFASGCQNLNQLQKLNLLYKN